MAVPQKPTAIVVVPGLVVENPDELPPTGLLLSGWSERLDVALEEGADALVVWDAIGVTYVQGSNGPVPVYPPLPHVIPIDEQRELVWYLEGYVVAFTHPDAREEVVHAGSYEFPNDHPTPAQHFRFPAAVAGRYGVEVAALGSYELRERVAA